MLENTNIVISKKTSEHCIFANSNEEFNPFLEKYGTKRFHILEEMNTYTIPLGKLTISTFSSKSEYGREECYEKEKEQHILNGDFPKGIKFYNVLNPSSWGDPIPPDMIGNNASCKKTVVNLVDSKVYLPLYAVESPSHKKRICPTRRDCLTDQNQLINTDCLGIVVTDPELLPKEYRGTTLQNAVEEFISFISSLFALYYLVELVIPLETYKQLSKVSIDYLCNIFKTDAFILSNEKCVLKVIMPEDQYCNNFENIFAYLKKIKTPERLMNFYII